MNAYRNIYLLIEIIGKSLLLQDRVEPMERVERVDE